MELFKLFGKIAVDNSEANRAIDDTAGKAEQSENRLSGAFKKIGAAVVTYLAVDKIKEFGQACVDMSAEVAAEQSAFEQIMGDYSNTAQEKVNEIADATGMVDTRLTPYMTSMTAKFKGLGYDIGDATDYAKQGLNIAADAAAFWDKSLDDSMSALNSFVNGSYEGGEAIGLFANDTQMAAYAVKEGLVSEAKEWSNLDEKIKQATRLEYAEKMQKASGAVGQAAKESKQYANVQANLNEKWRQFKAQIGEPILQNIVLPAMDKLSGFITNKLSPGFDNLKKKVAENKDRLIALKDRFVDCGKYLINTFSPAFSSLKELFITVKNAIKPLIDGFIGYSESGEEAVSSTNFLKEAIQLAADIIEKTCDVVADFVEWLSGGSTEAEVFKSIILTLAAGFTTYKGILLVVNAAEKAQISVTKGLAAAHALLNSMTPFGWAAVAATTLGALVAAAVKMSEPNDKLAEEFAKLSEEEQALHDRTIELIKSYDSWSDARDEAMSSIETEFGAYETLAEELDNIVDKNGKIKKGYEDRATIITGELSEALGIEIEIVDGVIQKYEEFQTSISDTIELQKAQAIQESLKDDYVEALEKVKDSQENYYSTLAEYNSTFSEIEATQSKLNYITGLTTEEFEAQALMLLGSKNSYMTQSEAIEYLQSKYDGLSEKFIGIKDDHLKAEEAYVDYNTTIKNYEGHSSAIISGDAEKIKLANDNLLGSFQTAETGTERSLKNQVKTIETELKEMQKAFKKGNTNITKEDLEAKEELYNQAKTELTKYKNLHGEKGNQSGENFAKGISSKKSEVNTAGAEIGQAGVDGVNSADYATPGSKAGETYASNMISSAQSIINSFINSESYNSGKVSIADFVAGVKSGNIPKFATGGIVDRATIAQIGEDGPEAVVPLKNNTEWIDLVAHKVAEAMGNGGTTVNYIFENVSINSDEDIEEYAYKLEAIRQKAALAMGGV